MMKPMVLTLVLSTLAGCSGWTKSAEVVPVAANVKLPELPENLRDCPRPARITDEIGTAETVGETKVLELWTRDRATAVRCRNRLIELVSYYGQVRDETSRIVQRK